MNTRTRSVTAAALCGLTLLSANAFANEAAPPVPPPPPEQAYATQANFGEFPWAVAVGFPDVFCSGVLVHPNFVITAAHCFDEQPGAATLYFREVDIVGDHHQTRTETARAIHPDYDADAPLEENAAFDIAVIRLDHPAYPTVIPVRSLPPAPGIETIASWGRTENGTPDWLRWGKYGTQADESPGYLTYFKAGDSSICVGDSGGGLFREISSGPQLMSIFVQKNGAGFGCGWATEFRAVPVSLPVIRDFLEWAIGNLDTLEGYGADERDRLYDIPELANTWIGHALLWKAYRSEETHQYFPPTQFPETPVECDLDPDAILDDGEAQFFSAYDPGANDDPNGGWGCHEVASSTDIYLAAAYSLHRWGSPAYVRAGGQGDNVAIDRINFEVYNSWTEEPASLLDACGWDWLPPLTAQAAADACDLTNYAIVMELVDGVEFAGDADEYSWCAGAFHFAVNPGSDIVFDPPEGEPLLDAETLARTWPEALAPRLRPAELEPAGPGFVLSEQGAEHVEPRPTSDANTPLGNEVWTVAAEGMRERIPVKTTQPGSLDEKTALSTKLTGGNDANGPSGFYISDGCTLP